MAEPSTTTFSNALLEDTLKKVRSKKTLDPHYVLIRFRYDRQYILPYKKGLELLAVMEEAEKYEFDFWAPPKLQRLSDDLEISMLSLEEYENIKAAILLQVPLQTIKEARNGANSNS